MICQICSGNIGSCDCHKDIKVGDTVEMIIPILRDGGKSGQLEQRIKRGLKNEFTVTQIHKGSGETFYLLINESFYHIENFRRIIK